MDLAFPKDIEATCYYCGDPILIRSCERADPPDYHLITAINEIKPIATCGKHPCVWKDTERQDALFNYVLREQNLNKPAGLPAPHGVTRS
jgi:hypothetical protein